MAPKPSAAIAGAGSGAPFDVSGAIANDAENAQPQAVVPPAAAAAADGGSHAEVSAESNASGDDAGTLEATDAGLQQAASGPSSTPPAADGGVVQRSPSAACGSDTQQTAAGRCGQGWQRRITLDGSQVSAPLIDFPVLVRISDPHVLEHAAAGGDDVYFTAEDGLTVLDFEIESYSALGQLVAWVRVPSLTAGIDTTLFLGYGDHQPGRAKPSGVWSDFHHVWHLAEDPSAGDDAIRDSTERAHGSAHGSMSAKASISAVAGPGLAFDGVDDEISFLNDLQGNGPSTFSGWVKQAGSPGEYGTSMISLGDGDRDGSARFMLSHADERKVKCGFYGDDDLTTAILPLDEWKYLSWTWDGSVSVVYIDAVRVLGPERHTRVNTSGLVGKIGNSSFKFAYFMFGQLDELHVATRARSSAWIATEYASQRPASTFIKALGEPEPAAPH